MRFQGVFTILAVVLAVSSSDAQQKTLTLDQARQIGLERNLNVGEAQNNVSAAQSGVLAAYGGYLPTLNASAGWSRTQSENAAQASQVFQGYVIPGNPAGTSLSNNFSTNFSANYTIFNGFGRESTLGQATSNAVSTEQISYRTRQSIVFQVESSYLNVLRNEQLVKVTEENLKRDQKQLERIKESNRVGSLSIADVYRQESQVASDELALISAQVTYDKAKADIIALIGLSVVDDYVIADPSVSTQIPKEELDSAATYLKNFGELVRRAMAARPDYRSAVEILKGAESGITNARSTYFPAIGASASYRMSNEKLRNLSDNKTINWGISLQWSLFDGFRTNQSLQIAIAQKRNAEISLQQTEIGVTVDVKKALLDLDASRKGVEVSQKGLVSATEDRKIAEEKYNLGAGTLLDLMVANANLVNAEANLVNASYAFVTSKRNVEYVVGERSY